MKRSIITLVAVTCFVFSAIAAQADVVTNWNYSVSGIFSNVTAQNNNLNHMRYEDGNTKLSWGTDNYTRSSIYLTNYASDGTLGSTMVTNGGLAQGLSMSHSNKTLSAGVNALTGGSAALTLTLNPFGTADELIFNTTLTFKFIETTNSGPNNQWDDVFVLIGGLNSVTETFMYDGNEYQFSFGASFDKIADVSMYHYNLVKDYVPEGYMVLGWVTKEGELTTIPTFLNIKSPAPTPTPEPGTLALLGLGLAGLGLVARRNRK